MSDIGAPGASQGGQGSGMGSGHGNGNQNGGGNPADANNPGVSTGIEGSSGAVDSPGVSRGYEGSTPDLGFNLGSPTGSHPDTDPTNNPGIGYGIQDVDIDVDYGYYDGFGAVENAMRSPAISPSFDFEDAKARATTQGYQSPAQETYGPTFSGMTSPMGFGLMSTEAQNTAVKNAANAAISRALGMDEAEARARTSTALGTMEQDAAINLSAPAQGVSPDSNPVGPTRSFQEQAMNEAMAIGAQRNVSRSAQEQAMDAAYHSGQLGTPANVQEFEANPNLIGRYDQRQFYSALDDEDATEEAKALEIEGFLDHINRKNYTDTGLLSKLGLRSPQLTQREQIAQVKNFLGKHQASIDALNKAYSKQINENPGFRNLLPGYKAITGLMGLIGLEAQHVHPSVQALYDKMVELGLMEKETPEMTDAKKIAQCNATPGYRWDTELNACVPINEDSDGSYNPYLGILG